MMRVGVEASIDPGLLDGFHGLEIVRIPVQPSQAFEVDFWIASLDPPTSKKQWPFLHGVEVVQGLWAGIDALRSFIPQNVQLCSARGIHDGATAEWAVTAVLAMQKYLPFYFELQRHSDWAGKSGAENIYLLSEGAKRDKDSAVLLRYCA